MLLTITAAALVMVSSVYCQEDMVSFQENFSAQLEALKSKVVKLENKVDSLEHKNTILTQPLRHSKREASFFPENEVAFSARVSQHVNNLAAHQPIVFGTVLTNIGNYYNNTTGVFYVPIAGTYQFFVNILSEADNNIETELVVNGNMMAEIYSGAGKYHGAGSNLVIVRLNQGDNVWVKVHAAFSSDMAVHCCWSTFTGMLIREVTTQDQIVG